MSRDFVALTRFIDGRLRAPYAWGRGANDCAAFVLGAVEAATGVRVGPKVRWNSRVGALRAIRRFGSIEAAFDAHFERIAPAFAHPGDIAAVPDPDLGIHPMVVEGATLVGIGEAGLKRCKRNRMIFAWSATALKV